MAASTEAARLRLFGTQAQRQALLPSRLASALPSGTAAYGRLPIGLLAVVATAATTRERTICRFYMTPYTWQVVTSNLLIEDSEEIMKSAL